MLDRYRMLLAVTVSTLLVVGVSDLAAGSDRQRSNARQMSHARMSLDLVAPETTITSGPSGTITTNSVSLTFSSSEPDSAFECKRNDAAWTSCSSPRKFFSFANGDHTISVRATDKASNTDATPASRSFTVDTTPPETTITSGPWGTITTDSASFAFTSSEAGSFECKLDAAAWSACSSPKAYSGVAVGAHTFTVRAKDGASNTDASPASRAFTVGTSPPAAGVIPGSGALVVQDLASDPDPSDLWVKSITADPTQGADNSRIRQNEYAGIAAAPDPHATINGSTTDTFRRFSVNENDQSAYDLSTGNTSERAQLINNSESNTFYLARDGAHDIVYMSVRMQSPAPNWGTGQAGESQLLQFKPVGPGVPFIISMQETANGLLLRHNYQKNPQTLWTAPAVKGQWIRIALDIEWAQQGSITVWGDIDGGSQDLVQLSPTMNVRTIPEDLYPQNLSIGVYQDRTAPALWRDYANIQVARAR